MRTARLAAGRPGACQKSLFDTLSNETRFTGLSFEKAAARGSARRARLRRPSHVCEPSGIFSDVHAAGENDSYFLCACGRKLCEAFVRNCKVPLQKNIPQGEIPLRDIEYAVTRWQ
jgi:hypothetical protein